MMAERCGSLTDTAFYAPLPLPAGGELVHATDRSRTVLMMWRPRSTGDNNDLWINLTRVHVARVDLDEAGKARILCMSVNAIASRAWVAAVAEATGFQLDGAQFKSTPVNSVPEDHWRLLDNAARRQMMRDAVSPSETTTDG